MAVLAVLSNIRCNPLIKLYDMDGSRCHQWSLIFLMADGTLDEDGVY